MALAKICGLSTPEAVAAALAGKAAYVGFMFFEKSPRNVAPEAAWRLAQPVRGKAKVFLAGMVHRVIDTALQLHGALGYSLDTPLAAWYARVRSQRLVDGPDEVHRWNVGKRAWGLIKAKQTTEAAR